MAPEAAAPRKILFLAYIHGFQGDHTTFGNFPQHLTALLSHRLPKLELRHAVYPTFETRGNLNLSVATFRQWLEEQVVDFEVQRGTASPTISPGVAVIIVGHSMGGIVGAESALAIAGEKVLGTNDEPTTLFPHVLGLMAFDTPYLGISPGVVAYGAEDQWKTGKAWYDTAAGLIGAGAALSGGAAAKKASDKAIEPKSKDGAPAEAAAGPWWTSKAAQWTGAGIAAAAATTLTATAIYKRENITQGFGWAASHLEFVGCLAKGEELRRRVDRIVTLSEERHVGFVNFYTTLAADKGAGSGAVAGMVAGAVGGGAGGGRPFCNLPVKGSRAGAVFEASLNPRARDEISAHVGMFRPPENPGFYKLGEAAAGKVAAWVAASPWSRE